MSLQHLREGLDPTGLTCISTSDLLQMIRAAQPYPKQGFAIFQSIAPDVITNPELAYFFWVKTIDDVNYIPTGEIHYYDGSDWQDFTKLNGARILPHTVDINALSLALSAPYDIIQINALGNALIWRSIPDAIQTNTIPADRLLAPDALNKYILTCFAGAKTFMLVSGFFNTIDNNIIPTDKLVRGGVSTTASYLQTKPDGTGTIWAVVDVTNLAAAGALAGQSIRRKSDNSTWEYYTAPRSSVPTWLPAVRNMYTGGDSAGWQAFNAGSVGVPVDAYAIMVQCKAQQSVGAGANGTFELRKNNTDGAKLLQYFGNIDGLGGSGWGIFPIAADLSFEYRSTIVSVGGVITFTVDIVGYVS